MRTIRGYTPEGKAIWVDHGPGYGGSVKIGGQLVTSDARRKPVLDRVIETPENQGVKTKPSEVSL